jgi:hypothetical protein
MDRFLDVSVAILAVLLGMVIAVGLGRVFLGRVLAFTFGRLRELVRRVRVRRSVPRLDADRRLAERREG